MIATVRPALFLILLSLLSSFSFVVRAEDLDFQADATAEVNAKIEAYHERLNQVLIGTQKDGQPDVLRPYAEYEKAKYLLISDEISFNTTEIKQSFVRNLPEEMELVVVTNWGSEEYIRKTYGTLIGQDRLHVIRAESSGFGFWARDGIPVPVLKNNYELALVDAKYYHHFEPDKAVSDFFSADLYSHPYFFEGGNFLADTRGNCFIVNNQRIAIAPDKIFKNYYGCKKLIRLKHLDGIGHVDERVKFINETTAFTDTKEYVSQLKELGYEVILLPRPKGEWQTYVNSLLVNGTVFLPVFGESNDQKVMSLYKSFGFKVVPLNSTILSTGLGSLHCITMTYPDLQFNPEEKVEIEVPEAAIFDLNLISSLGISVAKNDLSIDPLKCKTKVNGNLRKVPNSLSKSTIIKIVPRNSHVDAFYRSADEQWLLVTDGQEWGWMYEPKTLDCE